MHGGFISCSGQNSAANGSFSGWVLGLGLLIFSCHPFKSQPERIAEELLETVRAGYPVTDQFTGRRTAHAPLLTDALWRKKAVANRDSFEHYKQTVHLRADFFPIPVGLRGWRKVEESFFTDSVRFREEKILARCDDLTFALDLHGHTELWTFVMVEDAGSPGRNHWKCGRIVANPAASPETPLPRLP